MESRAFGFELGFRDVWFGVNGKGFGVYGAR